MKHILHYSDYYFNLQVCDLPLESYTCEMYYNDVRISNNNYLDIAYEEVNSILQNMSSALITIFSGYELIGIAVGIVICKYLYQKGKTIDNIEYEYDNNK
ncbi:hypothetical protein RhiirA5_433488 [Rhizophagus irregularis]|uniref:Uncharacterized protein n=1 Tax=Rhizophagus irregularis TaxID=588596 RepID=A0A2N0NRQ4_9GLOM|nr:hypothetical protein RhiirA5_433488 [Rhizophagus irregularis]